MPLVKDFSVMSNQSDNFSLPTTQHSIGGFYASVSNYVFGDMDDVGKLMGLAPYGKSCIYDFEAFEFRSGNLFVKEDWKKNLIIRQPDMNILKNILNTMPTLHAGHRNR